MGRAVSLACYSLWVVFSPSTLVFLSLTQAKAFVWLGRQDKKWKSTKIVYVTVELLCYVDAPCQLWDGSWALEAPEQSLGWEWGLPGHFLVFATVTVFAVIFFQTPKNTIGVMNLSSILP